MNRVTGTDGRDKIATWPYGGVSSGVSGTPGDGADEVVAGLGPDLVIVGGGDDLVFGDARELRDGWGDDDRIDAGPGNDIVWGDAEIVQWGGDDVIVGGEGDDVLYGDGWNTHVGGWDTLIGGEGNDRLYGDSPDGCEYFVVYFYPFAPPYVRPGGGPDKLNGGPGDDLLVGGTDNDRLKGGPGADVFAFADFGTGYGMLGSGVDRIDDFRRGEDRLDLTGWGLDARRLDANRDGRIDKLDSSVSRRDGALVIDLEVASQHTVYGTNEIVLQGVRWISVDDIVPLAPAS